MKAPLQFFIICFSLMTGCSARAPEQTGDAPEPAKAAAEKPDELPFCQIEAIESCDVESVGDTETVFRCPRCGTDVTCPDCAQKGCEQCSDEVCRCKLENPPKEAPGVTGAKEK